ITRPNPPSASSAKALQDLGGKTPADLQDFGEVAQAYAVLPVLGALDGGDVPGGDQGVAMDSHEIGCKFFLERLERLLDELLAPAVPDGDVLLIGEKEEHLLDRDQAQLAAGPHGKM